MTVPFKYIFAIVCVVCIILAASIFGLNQNNNTRTITEVKSLLSTMAVGQLRDAQKIEQDPKELVANLVSEVIKVQKNHGNDIRISYVFLNNAEHPTEKSDEIESVQFKIEQLNEDKEVRSQAEQRLSLNKVSDK
ncbi:hypothetical protein FOL75_04915 [Bacillus thuringiensis]|uniref:hypothetical protein n=1 Tax=Bacillus thuringiensis TaxID=1428 RepID=UPI002853ABAC|nr:hypothetical protein [Bacillus thuringiensis]MDR5021410.1 hypothetical protein [Bacillus thuringiensis]